MKKSFKHCITCGAGFLGMPEQAYCIDHRQKLSNCKLCDNSKVSWSNSYCVKHEAERKRKQRANGRM